MTSTAKALATRINKSVTATVRSENEFRLRTSPVQTAFRWVKGHEDNYGNIRADALADAGRDSDSIVRMDEDDWINGHSALQDGARLQALEASRVYDAMLRWHTKSVTPLRLQEALNEAKNKVEENTGLRPTNERLFKGIKALDVPPRLRDHMRCLITGRLKYGPY